MTSIARLPVQHRQRPHCETCSRPLGNFDGLSISLPTGRFEGQVDALGIRLRCECGEIWDLWKEALP